MVDILDAVITHPVVTRAWWTVGSTRLAPLDLDRLASLSQHALHGDGQCIFRIHERVTTRFEWRVGQHAGRVRIQIAAQDARIAEGGDEHVDDGLQVDVGESGDDGT